MRAIPLFSQLHAPTYPPTVDQGRRIARSPACLCAILKCNQDFARRCNELLSISQQLSRDATQPPRNSQSLPNANEKPISPLGNRNVLTAAFRDPSQRSRAKFAHFAISRLGFKFVEPESNFLSKISPILRII